MNNSAGGGFYKIITLKKHLLLLLFAGAVFFQPSLLAGAVVTDCINTGNATYSNMFQPPDTSRWIDNFREFRTAVYQQDKNKK